MKFNLKKSKLLFESRYKASGNDEEYTYEMLYKNDEGKYFIHFEGGKYSEYSVKIGFCDYKPRCGNYFIEELFIDIWKNTVLSMQKQKPDEYFVIDWEKEEEEAMINEILHNEQYLMPVESIREDELPF
ncbi:hypothetical protein [uncultured Clostridium sp.]|uniref:hypothetical protein n=1 Tax=uncultured Clostridium sp. TaxID=59620 RepID=UPI0025D360A7|nr:hypothetical protein [uncultured Clostridium sp.]